jgi:hypothetical protein
MTTSAYQYTSPLREWFREEARELLLEAEQQLLEAERNTIRLVIKARGFSLSDAHAKLISDCTGLDTLKAWSEAAVTASTVDDTFR